MTSPPNRVSRAQSAALCRHDQRRPKGGIWHNNARETGRNAPAVRGDIRPAGISPTRSEVGANLGTSDRSKPGSDLLNTMRLTITVQKKASIAKRVVVRREGRRRQRKRVQPCSNSNQAVLGAIRI